MSQFTTMLDQCTKRSWWGNSEIIKMSAPEAQAWTLKNAIKLEGRMLCMEDFKEITGYSHSQVRTGLEQLEKDEAVYSVRKSFGSHKTHLKFWGLK